MYRTIRLNLPKDSRIKQISRTAGRVYSKTVSLIRKTHKKKGFWLSKGDAQKYLRVRMYPLHSQTANPNRRLPDVSGQVRLTVQALTDNYFDALKSYFKLRKKDPDARPPFRTPKYHSIPFKQSAIKVKGD